MSADDTDNVKPKKRRPGAFDPQRAKEARARVGTPKGPGKAKGIAAEVRKHKRVIVQGLLELATSGTATARARALVEMARIGWGNPASAESMGTHDPLDQQQVTGKRGLPAESEGLMDILQRLGGNDREPAPYVPPLPPWPSMPGPLAGAQQPPMAAPLPAPLPPVQAPPVAAQVPCVSSREDEPAGPIDAAQLERVWRLKW